MSSQRRVAPALVMAAAIAGAAALAALFPLFASGRWSAQPDEWETAREHLIEQQLGDTDPAPAVPESITLLDRTPDGGFFYAAETADGVLQAGIVDRDGGGVICANVAASDPEMHCGSWSAGDAWHYALWVQRTPGVDHEYRHKLRFFASEAEADAYWATTLAPDAPASPRA